MEYSLQQRTELIIAECKKISSTNPYEIFHTIAGKDFVRIHGPEHHVLDGACILAAFHNAGGNIDLNDAMEKLMCEGLRMPGAVCGLWGVCGAVMSIGAALAIIDGTGPLSTEDWGSHMEYTSAALARLAQTGGPRCCKRDAFTSMEQAVEYIKKRYDIMLDMLPIKCDFSSHNAQCIGKRCPYKQLDKIFVSLINRDEIVAELFRLQDKKYAAFQAKLIPTVETDRIIGVRTPELRAFAKKLAKEENIVSFLTSLPHQYFDENQLHAFVISLEKDFDKCIAEIEAFLPFIDNWATCDQLSPKVFKKEPEKLLPYIYTWIKSNKVYTVRFAIGMLMQYFLDERFDSKYADMVAAVRSEEYYINMMIAWYFATALAKQYDSILPYLEGKKLDDWTHNKAIQKSMESNRITTEQKAYLKTLKIG